MKEKKISLDPKKLRLVKTEQQKGKKQVKTMNMCQNEHMCVKKESGKRLTKEFDKESKDKYKGYLYELKQINNEGIYLGAIL